MVNVYVTISVDPANRAELLSYLEPLTAASKLEEGCNWYQYWFHPTDQTQIAIVEQWATAEALTAHEATEHFTTLLPKVGELAKEVVINKF